MIAHCFCHPHTLVHCTSLVGLRVSYTSAGGELILHKTGRHNQVDGQSWRESESRCVWGVGTVASKLGGGGWGFSMAFFDLIRLSTEVIKSLMRTNIGSCHVALSAESRGATNEVVLMCDIHLHEILMRAEFCCLRNEGCSSQTAGRPLQLVKLW